MQHLFVLIRSNLSIRQSLNSPKGYLVSQRSSDLKNSGFPYSKTAVLTREFVELNLALNVKLITMREMYEQIPLHNVLN